MSSEDSTTFSASHAMAGYLYQIRLGLMSSLQKLKTGESFLVGIETLDDVTFFNTTTDAIELIQSKHHVNRAANLTDASEDLWKSLRIWFESALSGKYPDDLTLNLVTTSEAPAGSASFYLQAGESRDVNTAIQRLEDTVKTSQSSTNALAYQVFQETSLEFKEAILERVYVLAKASHIGDLEEKLKQEVYWAVDKDHHVAFLQRLEGWWYQRVIGQLIKSKPLVSSVEIEAQMDDLRESFKQDSLPVDDDLLNYVLDEATKQLHSQATFVRQLEIIKISKPRIAAAIRDYYKAFEQRSRWLRDHLLMIGDLEKYETTLFQEWEYMFLAMKDELGDATVVELKIKAGQALLKWAETAPVSIKPNVTTPFISRGSFHILANDTKIGWHPEFIEELGRVLFKENETI